MNVSEAVVVIDGRYFEWLFILLKLVIEFEDVNSVVRTEMVALLLGGFDLERRSFPELFYIGGGKQVGRSIGRIQQFFVGRFDKDLQVGLGRIGTDAVKGIDIARSRDQVHAGFKSRLGGLQVREVLRSL